MSKIDGSLAASALAHRGWAATTDRTARTTNGRAAAEQRFLDQADGDPVRAASLRKAWYAELALKSAEARRVKRRGAPQAKTQKAGSPKPTQARQPATRTEATGADRLRAEQARSLRHLLAALDEVRAHLSAELARIAPEAALTVLDPTRIKALMDAQGISNRELAKAAGWKSHTYLARLLSGAASKVRPDAADRIASRLGVEMNDLFGVTA